jgi:hypothetical protein
MDDQDSLWSMKSRMQRDVKTVDIVDLLHVTPRLWKAAKLFHPLDENEAESFVREQVKRILNGAVKSVIHSLRARATRRGLSEKKKSQPEVICRYFPKHKERMRYDEYLRVAQYVKMAGRRVAGDRLCPRAITGWNC